jgi:hypothetical protein
MKIFFLFVVLMFLPFVSASELRREVGSDWKEKFSRIGGKIEGNQVGTMSLVGTFPSSPVYASTNFYLAGCGTQLSLVETVLTGVCFSNGNTSEKSTCSKLMLLVCS